MRRLLSLPTPGARPVAAGTALALALALSGCGAGQLAQTRVSDAVIDGINADVGTIALRYVYVDAPAEGGVEGYDEGDDAPLFATFINQVDEVGTLQEVTSDAAEEVVILRGTGGDDTFGRDSAAGEGGEGSGGSVSVGQEETTAEFSGEPEGTIGDDEATGGDESSDGVAGAEGGTVPSEEPSPVPSGQDESSGREVSTLTVPSRLDTQLTFGVDYSFELRGLTRPLRPGELITVTFQFDSGTEELQVPVQALNVYPEEQEPPLQEEGEGEE